MAKFWNISATVFSVGLVVSGCAAAAEPITFTGKILAPIGYPVAPDGTQVRTSSELLVDGGECFSGANFSDIAEGTQVSVSNQAGEIVGLGRLAAGRQELGGREMDWGDWVVYDPPICEYQFEVEVPPGADFYTVVVGGGARGELVYTERELKQGINLTLGG